MKRIGRDGASRCSQLQLVFVALVMASVFMTFTCVNASSRRSLDFLPPLSATSKAFKYFVPFQDPTKSSPPDDLTDFNFVPIQKSMLSCAVCEKTVEKVRHAQYNPSNPKAQQQHDIQVQTRFRIDEKKKVPYYKTEFRLLEILEEEVKSTWNTIGACMETHQERFYLLETAKQHLIEHDNYQLTSEDGIEATEEDKRSQFYFYLPCQNYTRNEKFLRLVEHTYDTMMDNSLDTMVRKFQSFEDTFIPPTSEDADLEYEKDKFELNMQRILKGDLCKRELKLCPADLPFDISSVFTRLPPSSTNDASTNSNDVHLSVTEDPSTSDASGSGTSVDDIVPHAEL